VSEPLDRLPDEGRVPLGDVADVVAVLEKRTSLPIDGPPGIGQGPIALMRCWLE